MSLAFALVAGVLAILNPCGFALLPAASLRTTLPDPGADSTAGVKVAVIPEGNPVTENATAPLNPPLTVEVRVTLSLDPGATETALAEAVT